MIDTDALYPLVFKPVYKEVMWGGNKLEPILKRDVPPHCSPIGEAWEIVDRDDAVSIVENGPLKGETLRKLVEFYGKELIGAHFNGGKFPLLVKIIDAGKRLSLQVHPDEAACARTPGIEPKTEMWYIIQADKGAKIIAGLRNNTTKVQFLQNVASPEVERTLQIFDSVPGDAYFIKAGKVHSRTATRPSASATGDVSTPTESPASSMWTPPATASISPTAPCPASPVPAIPPTATASTPSSTHAPSSKSRICVSSRTGATIRTARTVSTSSPRSMSRSPSAATTAPRKSFGLYHIFVPAGKHTTVVKTTL